MTPMTDLARLRSDELTKLIENAFDAFEASSNTTRLKGISAFTADHILAYVDTLLSRVENAEAMAEGPTREALARAIGKATSDLIEEQHDPYDIPTLYDYAMADALLPLFTTPPSEAMADARLGALEGWRPIETCPKDRPFLAKHFPIPDQDYTSGATEVTWLQDVAEVTWDTQDGLKRPRCLRAAMFKGWPEYTNPPTHWADITLPTPPASQTAGQ